MRIFKYDKSACFYDLKNYKGISECLPYMEDTGVAELDLSKIRMEDVISSLYVPAGVTVQLYEHAGSTGNMDEYTGPALYNMEEGVDNFYSSIKVCKWACPS